ncbi:hypothetical protein Taro_012914, partial [Colocasia esculenta]|nr:hypothetical protein [Colocasia esculenta]
LSDLSLSLSLSRWVSPPQATFGGVGVAAPLLPPLFCVVEEVVTVVIIAAAALCCRAAAVSIASPPPCAAAPLLSPSRRRRSHEAVRGQCVKGRLSRLRYFAMTGKKVKLLDLENEQVAEGIVMSMDPAKIVMGRPIGTVYCEVSIHYANKLDAPLFVKDDHRFRIKDAIGSHILWFRDYVLVDEVKRTLFSG